MDNVERLFNNTSGCGEKKTREGGRYSLGEEL